MALAKKSLSRQDIETNKKLAVYEGSAYSAFNGFGGQYVVPYALKLGATDSQVGILASVPYFIGSVFQLLSGKICDVVRSRKQLIATIAFIQGLFLIPLFIIPLMTRSILILSIIFCLYIICDYMIQPIWHSLIGDIIPQSDRAEYFAYRNKISLSWLVISMVAAGIILTSLSSVNIWFGFWTLFTLAFFARTVSVILLLKHKEPIKPKRVAKRITLGGFLRHINSTNFGNYVIFRSAFIFAIMIASPFFTVYMLKNLGFSYWQFSFVVLTSFVVRAFTSPYWGRASKEHGNRNMMLVSSIIVASLPLIWFIIGFFFENSQYVFFLALVAEVIGGFGWGGFELTSYNYMMQVTEKTDRSRMFSYFNFFFGIFHMIGGLVGAFLIIYIGKLNIAFGTILAIFFMSFIIRLTIALTLVHRIHDKKNQEDERKMFVEVALRRPISNTFHAPISAVHTIDEKVEKQADGEVYKLEDGMSRLETEIKNLFQIKNHALHKRTKSLKAKMPKKNKRGA